MSHATATVKTNSFTGVVANFAPQCKQFDWRRTEQTGYHLFTTTSTFTVHWDLNSSIYVEVFDKNNV